MATATPRRLDTIADYWVAQGFTRCEALAIERDQVAAKIADAEAEDLYEAGIWNAY